MERSFREVLDDSHVAAVAIAVLLLWSLDSGVRAFGRPLFLVANFLVNVVAVRGIPYGSGSFTFGESLTLIPSLEYLLSAATSLGACLLVSRWVYGVGPFRSLSKLRTRLARKNYA